MEPLLEVLTLREIALHWHKHPVTVRRAIDARRNPLIARKSPDDERGMWLFEAASVRRRWGDPLIPLSSLN